MKRSPLLRKTPLRARSKKAAAGARALDAITPALVARSGGRCEMVVEGLRCPYGATERHHKLRRSQGGQHTVENIACLCGYHHKFVHLNPAWAIERGWLIRNGAA